VHNHVVGIITRKDLMPFKMQERLEKLLEQTTALNNSDAQFVLHSNLQQKRSIDSTDLRPNRSPDGNSNRSSLADKSVPSTFDAVSTYSGDVLPAVTYRKASSASKSTLFGHQEKGDIYSTASATEVEDSDPDHSDPGTLSQIVVTVSPPSEHSEDTSSRPDTSQ